MLPNGRFRRDDKPSNSLTWESPAVHARRSRGASHLNGPTAACSTSEVVTAWTVKAVPAAALPPLTANVLYSFPQTKRKTDAMSCYVNMGNRKGATTEIVAQEKTALAPRREGRGCGGRLRQHGSGGPFNPRSCDRRAERQPDRSLWCALTKSAMLLKRRSYFGISAGFTVAPKPF
jgi:hypothetical protein